jgi:hypothetical protein
MAMAHILRTTEARSRFAATGALGLHSPNRVRRLMPMQERFSEMTVLIFGGVTMQWDPPATPKTWRRVFSADPYA